MINRIMTSRMWMSWALKTINGTCKVVKNRQDSRSRAMQRSQPTNPVPCSTTVYLLELCIISLLVVFTRIGCHLLDWILFNHFLSHLLDMTDPNYIVVGYYTDDQMINRIMASRMWMSRALKTINGTCKVVKNRQDSRSRAMQRSQPTYPVACATRVYLLKCNAMQCMQKLLLQNHYT